MKNSDRYFKTVEWSNEDQCYIGSCPELCGSVCHGDNEIKVYKELCKIVDWFVEDMTKDGTPLPEPKFRNTFLRGNECFYDYFSAVLSEEKAAHKRGAAKAAPRQNSKLPAKESDRYLKVVEWSDEDQKYIGTCLELFGGGCHGKDEAKVYKELCGIVDWVIEDEKKDGDPLPEPTLRKKIAGKFFTLLCATTSEKNARRVSYPSESLNNYCVLREEAAVYNPGPAPKARKTKALKSNPKAQR